MAEYWVNFDVATTGNDGLSPANFWGWNEFDAHVGVSSSTDIFNCRGMKTLTANFEINQFLSATIRPWDLALYGPWRMYGGTTYNADFIQGSVHNACTLEDGIVVARAVKRGYSNNRMYIQSTVLQNYKICCSEERANNFCCYI